MHNPDIDTGRPFDWGRTSGDYAKYRDIYPPVLYDRLASLGIGVRGQRVLDLGTGTGVLPRNMYRYGARFTGIDMAEQQIHAARRLAAEGEMDIDFVAGPAEAMPFPADAFDAATACQCFLYFEKERLLPTLSTVLKDGALFAIVWMNWLPDESVIAAASERTILRHNPQWSGGGARRTPVAEPEWAASSPFTYVHGEAFSADLEFTRESWHGRIRACRGVAGGRRVARVRGRTPGHARGDRTRAVHHSPLPDHYRFAKPEGSLTGSPKNFAKKI
ncbi:MAG: class I SAM-dependent methyltransferase [Planctomycetaceae bacterium]|nr:class I SAM-dependent methyltransferase [Planctomycetaceae bacterium]